jgi:CRP-like cAMP-binding protein/di/tricarboxylate transporter
VSESSETTQAAEALASVPMFAALTPMDRAKLAAFLEDRWLDSGEVVFEAGGEGDALYILRSGTAERRVAGSPIGTIHPPEVFGELALFTDEPRSASVVALTPLHVWVLPRGRFHPLLRAEPELMFRLSAAISQRLARTRRALGELQQELDTWVAGQLAALDPADRELVEACALFERLSVAALARLTTSAPGAIMERLAEMARARLLIQRDQDDFIVPAAIRRSLLRQLDAESRRRPLAARLHIVARQLEREGRADDAVLSYVAAGVPMEAEKALGKARPSVRQAVERWQNQAGPSNDIELPREAVRRRAADGDTARARKSVAAPDWRRLTGTRSLWIALALVPLLGWGATPPQGLEVAGWRVLLTLVSAAILFASEALPDAVVALALLAIWVVAGLVAPSVALDGFGSQAWLLVLTVLAVGVTVAHTGLLYRAALAALERTPPGFGSRCLTVALVGVGVTPALPNATSRVALAAPLIRELAEALGYEARGRAAAGLGMAALVGFGQMSGLFLTGSSVGVLVHGLLPKQIQSEFSFGRWLAGALPLHAVLFALALGAVLAMYRPTDGAQLGGDRLALQRAVLGPIRRGEVLCLAVLGGLIAGFLTEPLHGVNGAWLGAGALALLAAAGVLDAGMLRSVNWPFLVFFGVITSLAGVFDALGIDSWLAGALAAPVRGLAGNAVLFCLALAVAGFVLAFVVRWQAAAPLLTLVALPTADPAGVHPFLVGLIALVSTQVWFLPYQSTVYLALYHGSGELFSHAAVRRLALLWAPMVLVSILVAAPVWRWMGLLR